MVLAVGRLVVLGIELVGQLRQHRRHDGRRGHGQLGAVGCPGNEPFGSSRGLRPEQARARAVTQKQPRMIMPDADDNDGRRSDGQDDQEVTHAMVLDMRCAAHRYPSTSFTFSSNQRSSASSTSRSGLRMADVRGTTSARPDPST